MFSFDKLLQRRKAAPIQRTSFPRSMATGKRGGGLLGLLAVAGAGYALKKYMTPDRRQQLGSKFKDIFSRFSGKKPESSSPYANQGRQSTVPDDVPEIPMRGAY